MLKGRNQLYALILIACCAGYLWVLTAPKSEICLIKYVTGVPCPSCGSTRSVSALMEGDFLHALYINPLGLIVATIMLIAPLWIIFDLISKRASFYAFYKNTENWLKNRPIAIILVALVLANWIWNIMKGL